LLNARFITHGWRPPFFDSAHVDLLHLARRLWRPPAQPHPWQPGVNILGTRRTGDDVRVDDPQMYFDYLRSGDPTPLKSVFYHNAMDVLSLASSSPTRPSCLPNFQRQGRARRGLDRLGRLFEDLGDLESPAPVPPRVGPRPSARIPRRRHPPPGDDAQARGGPAGRRRPVEQAARHRNLQAHVELAKVYEHRLREPARALEWTQSAIALVKSSRLSAYERRQWLEELDHRRARLQRKLSNLSPEPGFDDE
jgi:hypothetical protein